MYERGTRALSILFKKIQLYKSTEIAGIVGELADFEMIYSFKTFNSRSKSKERANHFDVCFANYDSCFSIFHGKTLLTRMKV